MEILLAAGANVDQQTKAGETALIAAVHYEDIEIISMLLRAGADARSLRDIKGKSALDYARDGEAGGFRGDGPGSGGPGSRGAGPREARKA